MLPNYLANIKSSGIYRFVFDKSEMPGQEAEILRLVVGYSEKGPFNTPVYVTTEEDFVKIFGGKSKKMERYGMWFHVVPPHGSSGFEGRSYPRPQPQELRKCP